MKFAAVGCHPFDGRDRAAVRLPRKHRAGFNGVTIDVNDARATLAGVTTHMRSGQSRACHGVPRPKGFALRRRLNEVRH
jgi:hypothetical protein